MRFLLISDTHGKLEVVNQLAAKVDANAVIHAGDFGFYDDGSYERLSRREIDLQITHSDLPAEEKTRLMRLSGIERAGAVRSAALLGEFQSYIDGARSFRIPVYVVWGNHEDRVIVEQLVERKIAVPNLHVLDGTQTIIVESAMIYGLGGNLLPGAKMMQTAIAGGGGKIWTTLSQYAELVHAVDRVEDWAGSRIFVSHVSPGHEPFVELLGARTRADITISGHMGPPNCMVWNPFAVRDADAAVARLRAGLESVQQACMRNADQCAPETEEAFSLIGRLPDETVYAGRRGKLPRWYRAMTHVNLPDAHRGYAVLDVNERRLKLQTLALE